MFSYISLRVITFQKEVYVGVVKTKSNNKAWNFPVFKTRWKKTKSNSLNLCYYKNKSPDRPDPWPHFFFGLVCFFFKHPSISLF